MRQVVNHHHHDLKEMLVVTSISGDNFSIILLNCMVS